MDLLEDISKLKKELNKTLFGENNVEDVLKLTSQFEKKYKKMAFEENINTQEIYDFFNLCHEINYIYSGKNINTLVMLILDILENDIGNMGLSKNYKLLIRKKAYLEEGFIYSCNECNKSFPVFVYNGFSDYINAVCADCGNILFICKYDSILKGTSLEDIEERLPICSCKNKKFKIAIGEQKPFGEDIGKTCIFCKASNLKYNRISLYDYFSEHNFYYYEKNKLISVEEFETNANSVEF